jgi:hypothetical protein
MNVEKVLADLREYKARLDECIGVFDRLARQRGEKRGRPILIPVASRRRAAAGRRKSKIAAG